MRSKFHLFESLSLILEVPNPKFQGNSSTSEVWRWIVVKSMVMFSLGTEGYFKLAFLE